MNKSEEMRKLTLISLESQQLSKEKILELIEKEASKGNDCLAILRTQCSREVKAFLESEGFSMSIDDHNKYLLILW